MKPLVNVETNKNVSVFINSITNNKRKEDSKKLVEIIQKITGKKPKIWGVSKNLNGLMLVFHQGKPT